MTDNRRCETCGLIPIFDFMEIHERDCREWITWTRCSTEFGSTTVEDSDERYQRQSTVLWKRLLTTVLSAANYR